MGVIGDIWNTLLYVPLVNIMVALYDILPIKNLALTILIFTIFTRIILLPLTKKTRQYQKAMQKLQPEMEKIKKKYEKDKEKLYQETMKLYSKHKANPAMGCLPLLIQLPFTIALYQALRGGLDPNNIQAINNLLYSFVPKIQSFNTTFLWLDLAAPDKYFILPLIVAGLTYVQSKISLSRMGGAAADTAKQTMIYMPLILLFITLRLPSGLAYYILLTTLSGIFEQNGISGVREFILSLKKSPEVVETDDQLPEVKKQKKKKKK